MDNTKVQKGQIWADGENRLTVISVGDTSAEVYVWQEGQEGGHPTTIGLTALRSVGFHLLRQT